jgi:hypothetical protein
MRCLRNAIALAAVVASTQNLAETSTGRQVKTTGELVELCSVTADDPSYPAAMGFCLGYIDAALDYHAALTSGARFNAIACPHADLTREEVVTVFLEWSKANPQLLDTEAPMKGVMRAVYEKWPCAGR